MTIVYSASPGTASKSLNKRLEIILNSKSILLNSYSGIGHIALDIPLKKKNLKKFKFKFFR